MNADAGGARLVITSGEPAGIGPDLVLQLARQGRLSDSVVVSDPDVLRERAQLLGYECAVAEFDPHSGPVAANKNQINIVPVATNTPVRTGALDPGNAEYVLKLLDTACDLCLQHTFDAMVTAPISKSVINRAGIEFTGHTEYLAARCGGNSKPVMLLSCPVLKIALVTTHLPLNAVSGSISAGRLETVLRVLWSDFRKKFALDNPSILVCGLNPHAGEDGYLGNEEQEVIAPVVDKMNRQGMNVRGPVAADTAFTPENRNLYDVFVCMYHDQGLPVLKALGFGDAVNITLGLPIIRTSVDHGVVLDLAGTGKANASSMQAAIKMAVDIANNAKTYTDIPE